MQYRLFVVVVVVVVVIVFLFWCVCVCVCGWGWGVYRNFTLSEQIMVQISEAAIIQMEYWYFRIKDYKPNEILVFSQKMLQARWNIKIL